MKKFKKYRVNRTRDDSPTGAHIPFQHILAFASETADFAEEENAHFVVCRACRVRVFYALRNVASRVERTITTKAA
jgi:hypothetical protein